MKETKYSEMDNLRLKCIQIIKKFKHKHKALMGMAYSCDKGPLTKNQCEMVLDIHRQINKAEKKVMEELA